MDAKEYLDRIRMMMREKELWERELNKVDEMLKPSAIRYDGDRITSTPSKDGLEKLAIKHMKRREKVIRKMNENISELIVARSEALSYIRQIKSYDQQEILILRYLDNLPWWTINQIRRTNDESSQFKLRDRAIESLQKILDKQ